MPHTAEYPQPEIPAESAERRLVRESLLEAGQREQLGSSTTDRLELLEQGSEVNQDSRRIMHGVRNVLERLGQQDEQFRLDESRTTEAAIAALLHDIGKSGPARATREQQQAVIRIYSVDSKDLRSDFLTSSLADMTRKYLASESEQIIAALRNCEIDVDQTMREFYRLHAHWTKEILENEPALSERVKIIAASHHIDSGVNPYNLPEAEVPVEAKLIGQMENYLDILEGRALLMIDKYEARIRRSAAGHAEAITWLRDYLNVKYSQDALVQKLLNVLESMNGPEEVFA